MSSKPERTIRLRGKIVPLLIKIVEKAYFESKDAQEKKLLADILNRLN